MVDGISIDVPLNSKRTGLDGALAPGPPDGEGHAFVARRGRRRTVRLPLAVGKEGNALAVDLVIVASTATSAVERESGSGPLCTSFQVESEVEDLALLSDATH